MEFLIISGLSGAGKSSVANMLEDLNYYCVDNMPIALLQRFAELCLATQGRYERVVLVTDVRGMEGFEELFSALDGLWELGLEHRILFVEADTATIVRRYKETRRPHPLLEADGSIEAAVERERELLAPIRERADFIVNTAGHSLTRLQKQIAALFPESGASAGMNVTVTAFGYKYGLPMDADIVFDVRFLPNPYYVAALRPLSGLDAPVYDYLFEYEDTRRFMERLEGLFDFLLPLYAEEGRRTLNIAVGCTGGKHRSVTIARALTTSLRARGYAATAAFRDVER